MRVSPHVGRTIHKTFQVVCAVIMTWLFVAMPAGAAEQQGLEGIARGFPSLLDLSGKKLADGDFAQWIENDRLHIRIHYEFGGGRRIEERAILQLKPQLAQEEWSWRELREGKIYREFELVINKKRATAQTNEGKNPERWSEQVDVQTGRAFAGIGFVLAIQSQRDRLIQGEKIELQTVGFTPKPRAVAVEIEYGGLDQMRMAGRVLHGDRFVIHPTIPWVVDLFVDVPDTLVWLANPPPAAFLRVEGPLAEPSDPVIRIDLLPGGSSGPAQPVRANVR
ncbi:MAG: hypothetical protein HY313_05130 [Acidobacteria bacterium]|nr:hypothetical protein [Acidobacteriota bacterium]